MASLDTFKICLMNHDHDYLDEDGGTTEANGLFWREAFATSLDPKIDFTLAAISAADNATFFGANF